MMLLLCVVAKLTLRKRLVPFLVDQIPVSPQRVESRKRAVGRQVISRSPVSSMLRMSQKEGREGERVSLQN